MFANSSAPLMMAVMWPTTAISLAFLGLRCYSKLRSQGRLWWDDHTLMISWTALLLQAIFTQVAISQGFGNHLVYVLTSGEDIVSVALWSEISFSFAVPAIFLSRVSFALTILRLTTGFYRAFVWFSIVTLCVIAIPSITLPWIICIPFGKVFDPRIPGHCIPKSIIINFGTFDSAYAAFVDFALAGLAWKILWNLQMKRTEKIGVGVAMSLGIFSGVAAIVKTVYMVDLLTGYDYSYDAYLVVIWMFTEAATAIIAGSIPVLRVLVKQHNRDKSASAGPSFTIATSTTSYRHHHHDKYADDNGSTIEMSTLVASGSNGEISSRQDSVVNSTIGARTFYDDQTSDRSVVMMDETNAWKPERGPAQAAGI